MTPKSPWTLQGQRYMYPAYIVWYYFKESQISIPLIAFYQDSRFQGIGHFETKCTKWLQNDLNTPRITRLKVPHNDWEDSWSSGYKA